jgi:hypothetical protein
VIAINITPNISALQKTFAGLKAKQMPFAASLALNNLAKGVVVEEKGLVAETFDSPTPFTQNAYRIEVATKTNLMAVVAAKDIQAEYLEPYVDGGNRSLGGKRGMLVPVGEPTNQYGNLTRTKLQQLKGRPNVFIGPVVIRGKVINGVWQRQSASKAGKRRRGAPKQRGPLKLLIMFKDTTPAPKQLDFYGRAIAYVRNNAAREFDLAIRRALATAR